MKLKIKYVDTGLAARFGNVIEINKALKKFPKLLKPILKHEREHTNKLFTLKDLFLDIKSNGINNLDLMLFIYNNPSTWISFLPIYFDKKGNFICDINACLIWFFGLAFLSAWIYFLIRIIF